MNQSRERSTTDFMNAVKLTFQSFSELSSEGFMELDQFTSPTQIGDMHTQWGSAA